MRVPFGFFLVLVLVLVFICCFVLLYATLCRDVGGERKGFGSKLGRLGTEMETGEGRGRMDGSTGTVPNRRFISLFVFFGH